MLARLLIITEIGEPSRLVCGKWAKPSIRLTLSCGSKADDKDLYLPSFFVWRYRRSKAGPSSSFKLGERTHPSPNLATGPARHLVSIFKVSAKNHAPLDADLI